MAEILNFPVPQYKGTQKRYEGAQPQVMRAYIRCPACNGSLFEIDEALAIFCIGCHEPMWRLKVEVV
jgi:uncharacterized protein with PIN domain